MTDKCLSCDSTNLRVLLVDYMPVIKGIRTPVIVDAIVCCDCNNTVMDSVQMDELRNRVKGMRNEKENNDQKEKT